MCIADVRVHGVVIGLLLSEARCGFFHYSTQNHNFVFENLKNKFDNEAFILLFFSIHVKKGFAQHNLYGCVHKSLNA